MGKAAAGQAGVAEAGCTAAELLPAVRTVAEALCAELPSASRARATSLTVQSDPDGARVIVDGQQVGRAPLTLPLSPGRHRVQASLAGCLPGLPEEVEAIAGQSTVVRLRLERRDSLDPWAHATFWPGIALVGFGAFCNLTAKDKGGQFNSGELAAADESRAWMGGACAAYTVGGLLVLTGAGLWIAQSILGTAEPLEMAPAASLMPDGTGAALSLGGRW
ncbi:MAG: PEGA domain-containing protein [Deltaproteobacteria bacterium]|nr:PEGA domain-containing protein [Deltaproteobacteria bacterium]